MLGSIFVRTAVCGSGVVESWNGPLIRMLARSMPMNDIISVVMISFVPYFAFRTAGTTVQTAPTAPASRNRTVKADQSGMRLTSFGA